MDNEPLLVIEIHVDENGLNLFLTETKFDKTCGMSLQPGKQADIKNPDGTPLIRLIHPGIVKKKTVINMRQPKWTLFTNIDNGQFVGMQWEFFDDDASARAAYLEHHKKPGQCPMLRAFHENDRIHMGAVHK